MAKESDKLEFVGHFSIEPLTSADQDILWEMLYQALYAPPGNAPFEREVVNQPAIARYVKDWGRRTGDFGFKLIVDDVAIGAVWLRILTGDEKGFGYVDDDTPELGMALLPDYRGLGFGTELLSRALKQADFNRQFVSLSVARINPARRLYERFGFEAVNQDFDSLTMKRTPVVS